MEEISLILKSSVLITIEEFRILDRYSCTGKIWTLIQRPSPIGPILINQRRVEYILDPETLTILYIISNNILATWNTDITRNLGPNDEFHLKDSLFIRPYSPTSLTPLKI